MNSPILEIPVPSLVLLIGSSGSGKSTFAARHFQPTEIISSDRCRALICDDESDQTINAEAFELLHHIARLRLQRQKLTVIDATNLQFRDRQPLLSLAQSAQIPAVAIVFEIPLETCLTYNQARPGRQVAPNVLEYHQQLLALTRVTIPTEGFSLIYPIEKADLPSLIVEKKLQRAENSMGN
jgi:protein phosphatase